MSRKIERRKKLEEPVAESKKWKKENKYSRTLTVNGSLCDTCGEVFFMSIADHNQEYNTKTA